MVEVARAQNPDDGKRAAWNVTSAGASKGGSMGTDEDVEGEVAVVEEKEKATDEAAPPKSRLLRGATP